VQGGDSVTPRDGYLGYKLHITSSTGSLIVPLLADFTQADVQDNQIYPTITSSLLQGVRYMAADSGYDDHKLYNLSITRGFELVCPVSEIYNNTSSERLRLIHFYESELGQAIYYWRSISVETLIEHIKDAFKRPFTSKRIPESNRNSTDSSITLSNHCLLQL
jgi:Transposase DDE domain